MKVSVPRRSVLTIFSGTTVYSDQVRFMLAEKEIEVDIVEVDLLNKPEDLLDVNPYGTLPTLLERDLVIYEPNIIMEYLDERFPYPPLMPVYPVERAKTRMIMHRMKTDWFSLYEVIMGENTRQTARAREALTLSLVSVARAFSRTAFFMSDAFSILDCCLAPFLWRLPSLKIILPTQAAPIIEYAERVFNRDAFKRSFLVKSEE
jgi:RNA polymerase-associated protein